MSGVKGTPANGILTNTVALVNQVNVNTNTLNEHGKIIPDHDDKIVEHDQKIAEHDERIANNEEELAKNGSTVSENAQNIAQNGRDIAQNAQDITQNASDIAKNTNTLKTHEQLVTKNTQDIAKNTQDISDLGNEVKTENVVTTNLTVNGLDGTTPLLGQGLPIWCYYDTTFQGFINSKVCLPYAMSETLKSNYKVKELLQSLVAVYFQDPSSTEIVNKITYVQGHLGWFGGLATRLKPWQQMQYINDSQMLNPETTKQFQDEFKQQFLIGNSCVCKNEAPVCCDYSIYCAMSENYGAYVGSTQPFAYWNYYNLGSTVGLANNSSAVNGISKTPVKGYKNGVQNDDYYALGYYHTIYKILTNNNRKILADVNSAGYPGILTLRDQSTSINDMLTQAGELCGITPEEHTAFKKYTQQCIEYNCNKSLFLPDVFSAGHNQEEQTSPIYFNDLHQKNLGGVLNVGQWAGFDTISFDDFMKKFDYDANFLDMYNGMVTFGQWVIEPDESNAKLESVGKTSVGDKTAWEALHSDDERWKFAVYELVPFFDGNNLSPVFDVHGLTNEEDARNATRNMIAYWKANPTIIKGEPFVGPGLVKHQTQATQNGFYRGYTDPPFYTTQEHPGLWKWRTGVQELVKSIGLGFVLLVKDNQIVNLSAKGVFERYTTGTPLKFEDLVEPVDWPEPTDTAGWSNLLSPSGIDVETILIQNDFTLLNSLTCCYLGMNLQTRENPFVKAMLQNGCNQTNKSSKLATFYLNAGKDNITDLVHLKNLVYTPESAGGNLSVEFDGSGFFDGVTRTTPGKEVWSYSGLASTFGLDIDLSYNSGGNIDVFQFNGVLPPLSGDVLSAATAAWTSREVHDAVHGSGQLYQGIQGSKIFATLAYYQISPTAKSNLLNKILNIAAMAEIDPSELFVDITDSELANNTSLQLRLVVLNKNLVPEIK